METEPAIKFIQSEEAQNDISNIFILKYGSDPLLTYLPDSDIDITIIVNNQFKRSDTSG